MPSKLTLYRRHFAQCPHTSRKHQTCKCPIWCDGYVQGRRIRRSLETVSWSHAETLLVKIAAQDPAIRNLDLAQAIEIYLADCRIRDLKPSTIRSYRKTLTHFRSFAESAGIDDLDSLTLEHLTQFRMSRTGRARNLKPRVSTLAKEIEHLRSFSAFALERGWIEANLAKKLKPGKGRPPVVLPFEEAEITALFNACAKFGHRETGDIDWARRRIRTFMLLLLYSGLRISDAAALKRSALDLRTGHLRLRIQIKTGNPVQVKLPAELIEALSQQTVSSEGPPGPFFFWNGTSKIETLIGLMRRAIDSISKKAHIHGHPHRFRDTFAKRLLDQDVPIRTVQLLLGHASVRTTERHYGHFVLSQQRLLDDAAAKLPNPNSLPQLPELALQKRIRNTQPDIRTRTA